MNLEQFFDWAWKDYLKLFPSAKKINELLVAKGEQVINDHIALRTFAHPKINKEVLAHYFESLGYKHCQDYEFSEKKLSASHYEHTDPIKPKVFISELRYLEFSPFLISEVERMISTVPKNWHGADLFSHLRPWNLTYENYKLLYKESEYAAWLGAIGFRPNHFTVSLNKLKSFSSIQKFNEFLKQEGFKLNSSGGEIKGSPKELLEQSSIMADKIEVEFSDGKFSVPSCYYEFALRYPDTNGKLYSGFVAKSADKIFESTNEHS